VEFINAAQPVPEQGTLTLIFIGLWLLVMRRASRMAMARSNPKSVGFVLRASHSRGGKRPRVVASPSSSMSLP